LFEKSRLIFEHICSPYHPDTLVIYNNLARMFDAMGGWINLIFLLNCLHGGNCILIFILSSLLQHKSKIFRHSHSHGGLGGLHKFLRNFESFSMILLIDRLKNKKLLKVILVSAYIFKPLRFSFNPLYSSASNFLVGQ